MASRIDNVVTNALKLPDVSVLRKMLSKKPVTLSSG
jgi:hypothetical protein